MKFSRVSIIIGMTFVLLLLTLILAACGDSATPTPAVNSTTATTTAAAQTAATTLAQLPTFTSAATPALPTVTPAPATTTNTTATSTTAAPTDTTTIALTTVASTTDTTTVAPTDTTTVMPANTTPAVTTTAPSTTSVTTVIATPKPTTTVVGSKISPVFNPVLADLRRQKEVAVILPTYIPGTDAGTVYAVIERSDKPGYSVVLGYTPDCEGGTACRIGTVSGLPEKVGAAELKGTKVKLSKNITGYYVSATCEANCPDSTITWKQGKGVYSVGIKAGKIEELTKMANSAIVAGQI